LYQDENARSNALRAIEENTAKMKSEKKKADQYEEDLEKEEKVLEGIRDSLKGFFFLFFFWSIVRSFVRQTRRRYFMIRSSRSRRSFNLGKRR